jgi:hypothetical protein
MNRLLKVLLLLSVIVNIFAISFIWDIVHYGNEPDGYKKMCKFTNFVVTTFLMEDYQEVE